MTIPTSIPKGRREKLLKTILISICNSLMAVSITHTLRQVGDFRVCPIGSCGEIAKECAEAAADVLLMEASYNPGATLDDRLSEAAALRFVCPSCKVILLCDENSAPEIARQVAIAKKDGLIDDFVYSSVSESYLIAMLYAI
jgi:hypothetical protein